VISLDDCERISRALDPLIDEWPGLEDLSFSLEVSSPGLFRPLSAQREFDFYRGRPVRIEARPSDAEKAQAKKQLKKQAFVAPKVLHEGILQGFDSNQNKLTLKKTTSDELLEVPLTADVAVVLNPEIRLPDDGTESATSES
jgi:ribosome maturation factor RimP